MNNFLYFTDSHLRLSPTRRRTDDMFAAQLRKLEFIAKRAEDLKSEFVLCGGDLGDSWDWKISMVNKVAEVLRKFPVSIYTIIGNHDVPGRNPELWKDTGIGLLDSMGVLKVLHPASKEGLLELSNGARIAKTSTDFAIMPFHSDEKITDDFIGGKEVPIPLLGKLKVAVVHAPVGAESTPFSIGHKDLVIKDFDVALFGDIHPGWPVYKSPTGCKICNPGSLTRLAKPDIYRVPKIAVVYSNGKVVYEDVPCTLPEDCFDLSGIQVEKEELGKGFLAAIAAQQLVKDINPKEYVAEIGKAANYSKRSIEILVNEI